MSTPETTWTLASPQGAGALAIIQLHGDIDAALAVCGIRPVAAGRTSLRNLFGIDTGLIARFTPGLAQLMPHGGAAVVRALGAELTRRGITENRDPDPAQVYPEARSGTEARALAALARATSPLAVDVLLAQHELWLQPEATSDPTRDRILNRLIDPPLVVALGASNIGKSTLVNALAGRSVSIVADEPGTTRDHVGVMLDLAGLVVRYVDTPGLRGSAEPLEREAVEVSLQLASAADLILLCGDATAPPPQLSQTLESKDHIVLALRSDLGPPSFLTDVAISAGTSQGLPDLVNAIRERLVPAAARDSHQPWKFW